MWKKLGIFAAGIYVVTSLVSYAAFAAMHKSTTDNAANDAATGEQIAETESSLLDIPEGEARDQACPLNGQMYTKTEKDAWEQRRPLAVMIENHPDARPQSGLGDADVMFEMLAEGGVTRFMGIFYCGVQREETTLAPVRSARTYFMDYASGFNLPMYVHVGGANTPGPADSLGQIEDYGWAQQNDINQFSIGYPTFVRNNNRLDKPVATEHTMETSTELLWDVATKRGWTNMSPDLTRGKKKVAGTDWKAGYKPLTFTDDKVTAGKAANTVAFEFWSGYSDYGVKWTYDPTTSMYNRDMGGSPHVDLNTDKQIQAKNVVVLLIEEKGPIDELKHLLYTTTGTGDALIFIDGTVQESTWKKASRESELEFFTSKGQPIEFARGLIWISGVDTTTEVRY